MKLFKNPYTNMLNKISELENQLSKNREEMVNLIEEIKHPLGTISTFPNFLSWIHTYTYIYYNDGRSYKYAIPVCKKYIIRKDDRNIYLKLQFEDESTLDYLIQIGNKDLIEINSNIIDTEIENIEWKNIEIGRWI